MTSRTCCRPAKWRHSAGRRQNSRGSARRAVRSGAAAPVLQMSPGSSTGHKRCEFRGGSSAGLHCQKRHPAAWCRSRVWNTAGSSMSFQMPATPMSSKPLVKRAPPLAGRRVAEIREHARTGIFLRVGRPDRGFIHRAVGIFHEIISRDTFVVRRVALFHFGMRIHDGDHAKMLRAQIRNHFLRVGKTLVIPGERLVVVLVMNIQPDDVGGNFLLAERVGHQPHAGFGIIAVTALVIAQRPERRQRHPPGQCGVTLNDFFRVRAVDEIIIQIAARRAESQQSLVVHGQRQKNCARCCREIFRAPAPGA